MTVHHAGEFAPMGFRESWKAAAAQLEELEQGIDGAAAPTAPK